MGADAAAARVREATDADLAGVLALYRHLTSDPPPDAAAARIAWEGLMGSELTHVAVAQIGEALVATCMIVIVPNLSRGARPFAVIENVVTDPAHRKQGLGTAVLHFAMEIAWAAGCYKVMLSSGRTEEATLRFYEKAGFRRGTKTFFEARRI